MAPTLSPPGRSPAQAAARRARSTPAVSASAGSTGSRRCRSTVVHDVVSAIAPGRARRRRRARASIWAGSAMSSAHLAGDRREPVDREVGQRRLEGGELRAAELARARFAFDRVRRAPRRCRRGSRPRARLLQALDLGRQRLGIGLGLADLLGDGVGVVGQVDARIVGRVRLRHLLRAVAQAHDARRRALDQRLGQREEALVASWPRGGDRGRRSRC